MACILMRADPMESREHCGEFEGHADWLHHVNSSLTRLSSAHRSGAHSCALRLHAQCGWPLVDDHIGWMNEWFSFVRFKLLCGSIAQPNGNILRASMILLRGRFREKQVDFRVRCEPKFKLQHCHFLWNGGRAAWGLLLLPFPSLVPKARVLKNSLDPQGALSLNLRK